MFLVGGARSGKSGLAQTLAGQAGAPVTFVATATAGDADMAARIARHQADRPAGWSLVEAPLELVRAVTVVEPEATVVVDCLTLWVANLVFDERSDAVIETAAQDLARALGARPGCSIVVSNEVGMSIHPPTAVGRRYQDVLGRVNQLVAARSGRCLLLAAGRALELSDPGPLLAGWPPAR